MSTTRKPGRPRKGEELKATPTGTNVEATLNLRDQYLELAKGKSIEDNAEDFVETASLIWDTAEGQLRLELKGKEGAVKMAAKALSSAKVNGGLPIGITKQDQELYLRNVIHAQNEYTKAVKALEDAEKEIQFYSEMKEAFNLD